MKDQKKRREIAEYSAKRAGYKFAVNLQDPTDISALKETEAYIQGWLARDTSIGYRVKANARKKRTREMIAYCKKYREAYTEEVFTPLAPGEKNDGTDVFTTRVSAQMGRFILDNIIRDLLNGNATK